MSRRLRRGVYQKLGHSPFYLTHNAEVGNDDRVDAYPVKTRDIVGDLGKLLVVNEGIHRDVQPYSVKVGIAHRLPELVYIEVFGKRASAEALTADVDRVRAAEHGANICLSESEYIPCTWIAVTPR